MHQWFKDDFKLWTAKTLYELGDLEAPVRILTEEMANESLADAVEEEGQNGFDEELTDPRDEEEAQLSFDLNDDDNLYTDDFGFQW